MARVPAEVLSDPDNFTVRALFEATQVTGLGRGIRARREVLAAELLYAGLTWTELKRALSVDNQLTLAHMRYFMKPAVQKLCRHQGLLVSSRMLKDCMMGLVCNTGIQWQDVMDALSREARSTMLDSTLVGYFNNTWSLVNTPAPQNITVSLDDYSAPQDYTASKPAEQPAPKPVAISLGQPAAGSNTASKPAEQPAPKQAPKPEQAAPKQRTGERVALCIGVSNYGAADMKLRNAARDAKDMKETLDKLGFDYVKLLEDPTRDEIRDWIHDFTWNRITQRTELALLFYAGHGGVSVGEGGDGHHYMMARDWSDLNGKPFPPTAQQYGYSIEKAIGKMELQGDHLNVVIVDACRAPARGGRSRGPGGLEPALLAWGTHTMSSSKPNTLVCNATKNMGTASDGAGRNGLYTTQLLRNLQRGANLWRAINQTNLAVYESSAGEQKPDLQVTYSIFFEDVIL